MQRLFIKNVAHLGNYINSKIPPDSYYTDNTEYKTLGFDPVHSPDFRPELKQDFSPSDVHYEHYVSLKDRYRVYMPLRYNYMETNTKYLNQILKVIENYCQHLQPENKEEKLSLEENYYSEIKQFLPDILAELASEIYISEHRYRYQAEQTQRLKESLKHFNTFKYDLIHTKSIADFALEYNNFIWNSIKKSHGGICPQIKANRRGNYHEKVSQVDKVIYSLYFKNSFMSKLIASVLTSAYKNPKIAKQKSII